MREEKTLMMEERRIVLPIGGVDWRTWKETSIGWFSNIFDSCDVFVEKLCGWFTADGKGSTHRGHVSEYVRSMGHYGCRQTEFRER